MTRTISPPEPRLRPERVLLHGPSGVGKTQFPSESGALILDCESGSGRFPYLRLDRDPTSWKDLIEDLDALLGMEPVSPFLFIDPLDACERWLFEDLRAKYSQKSIELIGGGYGKGLTMAHEIWRSEFLVRLEELQRTRNYHVLTSSHTRIRTFSNPLGENFDRYELNIHSSKATDTAGLLRGWHDAVLFLNYETFVVKDEKEKTGKAVHIEDNQARWLYTEHRPAFDAKNRYGLPYKMPLDWGTFWEAVEKSRAGGYDPQQEVLLLLPKLPEAMRAKAVEAFNAAKGSPSRMRGLLNHVRIRLSQNGG